MRGFKLVYQRYNKFMELKSMKSDDLVNGIFNLMIDEQF